MALRSLTVDVVGIQKYLQGAQKDGLIRVDLGANNCAPPLHRSCPRFCYRALHSSQPCLALPCCFRRLLMPC